MILMRFKMRHILNALNTINITESPSLMSKQIKISLSYSAVDYGRTSLRYAYECQ